MYEPHALTSQQSAAVQSAVSSQLKDPESARYTDFRARKVIMPGGKVAYQVCGYVNSKNSFGGYVGKTPFAGAFPWSQPERFVITGVGQDWQRTGVMEGCAQLGLPLPA
ncbi:MAG: hypothetical protein H6876_09960 [Hyphomicrobiaceae bacterium]|nr:hypothetical protein [Hyphomicrobiaceae bacterium]MCC0008430.1 hypothetical protein [Hyphomicrobiaceae bacterium]